MIFSLSLSRVTYVESILEMVSQATEYSPLPPHQVLLPQIMVRHHRLIRVQHHLLLHFADHQFVVAGVGVARYATLHVADGLCQVGAAALVVGVGQILELIDVAAAFSTQLRNQAGLLFGEQVYIQYTRFFDQGQRVINFVQSNAEHFSTHCRLHHPIGNVGIFTAIGRSAADRVDIVVFVFQQLT